MKRIVRTWKELNADEDFKRLLRGYEIISLHR